VSETARFFVLLAASAAAAAAAILALRSRPAAGLAARVFLWLCVIPAAAVLLERVGIAAGILRTLRPVERIYSLVLWIVLGVAAASAILSRRSLREPPGCFVRSSHVLRGLCLVAALGYLAIEAGKLAHDAEMREFFTASGYPVAMMYAVMAAEILGAVGLLVPRTRVPAAAGLSLLMLGAIGTHLKNGDPFSDSLDAARLLVLLSAIAALAGLPRARGQGASSPVSSRRT
jgi:uncharacterized membrane protein YphA (DoxX/SURF4 family)